MRKLFIISILLLCLTADAQQLPQFTHYRFNQFAFNPALAGYRDCLDINLAYRTQWVGFDGAPKTGFIGASAKLGKSKQLQKHGIGGTIVTDQSKPFFRTNINLAYAYHFRWSRELSGSFGLFAGISQYKFDASTLNVPPDTDPILIRGSQTALIYPEISPGMWLFNRNFYFGLSINSLLGNKLKNIGDEGKLSQHIFVTSGKAYKAGDRSLIIPSFQINYEPGSAPSVNLNLMYDMNEVFAFGASYRNVDAASALIRLRIFNNITLGYAYDYTLSSIRLASANTHEVSIQLLACPQNFGSGKTPCAAYQ